MRFVVDERVFEVLEDVCFGIVVARGVDNRNRLEAIERKLNEGIDEIRKRFNIDNYRETVEYKSYRDAFNKLKINPNKFQSSIEALSKRILKGDRLPSINNIVDLGNAMCLKYVVPLGAHDLDKLGEDLMIRFSNENDSFLPFGMTESEKVDEDELVYVSGNTVKTRKWIWRQSDEGKITEESTNIFFPIDGFKSSNYEAVISARNELAETLKNLFGCEVKVGMVDKENKSFEL